MEVTQSTILDHLIGLEQKKYEDAKAREEKDLTPEDLIEKANYLTELADALRVTGKYRKQEIANDTI